MPEIDSFRFFLGLSTVRNHFEAGVAKIEHNVSCNRKFGNRWPIIRVVLVPFIFTTKIDGDSDSEHLKFDGKLEMVARAEQKFERLLPGL